MSNDDQFILTLNGGSSSIKFATFTSSDLPQRRFSGQIERIGQPGARLVAKWEGAAQTQTRPVDVSDYHHAGQTLAAYLKESLPGSPIIGIGHRIVHGGTRLFDNQRVTPNLIDELRRSQPLDIAHLPGEISLLEIFGRSFADVPQVVCFDTAFYRDLPRVASMLPIPRRYFQAGVKRLGFHGLSYTYLMERLNAIAGTEAAHGRVILAHLGAGASMTAVRGGKPIDTTMAFTPTAGLVMATRPGDLDPGLLVYLMRAENLTPSQMDEFISNQCGLLGISQISPDMRELLKRRATDAPAADAVACFCYCARKTIGAFAAATDGLDTLVFSGGIGEHSSEIRAGICEGLNHLGIRIDPSRNASGADVISCADSRVTVRVIRTDEQIIIAQAVRSTLASSAATQP